jgi:aryl-alcohol dehydrogenase-like predicted oxidoreductase
MSARRSRTSLLPGTASIEHLEENVKAAGFTLEPEQHRRLVGAGAGSD